MTTHPAYSGSGDLFSAAFGDRLQPTGGPASCWRGLSPAPLPVGDRLVRGATAVQGLGFHATSVKQARDFTTGVLDTWGLTRLRSDALLVVSEMVTNACRHAAPTVGPPGDWSIQFGLVRRGLRLECLVFDPSRAVPVRVDPDRCAEGGRGLHLIESFSTEWGWDLLDGQGKVVWAAFDANAN